MLLRLEKYEKEKMVRNERAKRQILRKCQPFLIENNFIFEDFLELKNTDDSTIKLAKQKLEYSLYRNVI